MVMSGIVDSGRGYGKQMRSLLSLYLKTMRGRKQTGKHAAIYVKRGQAPNRIVYLIKTLTKYSLLCLLNDLL